MTVITLQEGSHKDTTSLAAATGRPAGGTRASHGAVRHADNPAGYSTPSPDQARLTRGSRIKGTVIPSATKQGGSTAFDATRPAPTVNIICLDEDGRHDVGTVDLTQVTPELAREAIAEAGDDSIAGWQRLAEKTHEVAAKRTRKAEASVSRTFQRTQPSGPTMASAPGTAQQPAPAESATDETSAMFARVMQQNHLLMTMMASKLGPQQDRPQDAIDINGQSDPERWTDEQFASLGLDFLTPQPSKPKERVVFNRPGIGSHNTRYHAIEVAGAAILLIFDSRCDDYDQFVPEQTPDHEFVKITIASRKNAVYNVVVPGVNWTIGCLDIVLLLIRDPINEPESEEHQEEDE